MNRCLSRRRSDLIRLSAMEQEQIRRFIDDQRLLTMRNSIELEIRAIVSLVRESIAQQGMDASCSCFDAKPKKPVLTSQKRRMFLAMVRSNVQDSLKEAAKGLGLIVEEDSNDDTVDVPDTEHQLAEAAVHLKKTVGLGDSGFRQISRFCSVLP